MNTEKIVEWDEDETGLVCFVTEIGDRWFAFRIPENVWKQSFLRLQDQLRELIQLWKEN